MSATIDFLSPPVVELLEKALTEGPTSRKVFARLMLSKGIVGLSDWLNAEIARNSAPGEVLQAIVEMQTMIVCSVLIVTGTPLAEDGVSRMVKIYEDSFTRFVAGQPSDGMA